MRAEERKTTTWRGPRARGTRPTGAIEGRVATRVSRAEAGGASTHRELLLRLGHEVLGFGGVVRHRDDRVGVRATQCGRGERRPTLGQTGVTCGCPSRVVFSFFSSVIKATAATCVFKREGSLSSSFVSASYQRFRDDKKRAETVTPHVFFIQSASSSPRRPPRRACSRSPGARSRARLCCGAGSGGTRCRRTTRAGARVRAAP